jgi:capsular exopolysaccharide synthesis family protein
MQTPKYESTAEVRLAAQPLSDILSPQHLSSTDAARYAATQAQAAATAPIAKLAIRRAGVTGMTAQDLLAHSSVTSNATSDFLDFTVTDRSRDQARLLATSYAEAFTQASNKSVVAKINAEIIKLQAQADKVQSKLSGTTGYVPDLQAQYRQLLSTIQALQIARAAQGSSTVVAQTAQSAAKVSPKPQRNIEIALGLGIFLGLAVISLVEAVDRRVRDSDEIQRRLGLHLLGRIPTPRRDARRGGRLAIFDGADGEQVADIFQRLRVSLDFANVKQQARTLMVTSAVEREGKSTTAANLALALAGAGRQVALVDLDLRRPVLADFFGLSDRIGATTVMLGQATVDDALQPVALPSSVAGPKAGGLMVVTSGPLPPHPPQLLEADATSELLEALAARAEIVIIDSAPLLPVSDSVVLGGKVEGVVVIVRSEVVTRPVLNELHRTLSDMPAPKLGFVLTGAEHDAGGYGYGYGYGRGYGYKARPEQQSEAAQPADVERGTGAIARAAAHTE